MVSQKKWMSMSANEKLESLHQEVTKTENNTRSLKKIITGVIGKVNEIRRYMGMKPTT